MKKDNWRLSLVLLFLLVPFLVIFKSFFNGGVLSFGDAPFYYPENLKELFNLPFLWDIRSSNFGASALQVIWLYIPTFLMGCLNRFFNLESPILLRLVFYFPATVLAAISSWFFLSKFTKNYLARILGVFLYLFNTYFLLLIDGGQVGVALSYGVFPLTQLLLIKYLERPTIRIFIFTLTVFFLLSSIDLRIFFISFILPIFFNFFNPWIGLPELRKKISSFLVLIGCLIGLDLYWIIPLAYSFLHPGVSMQASLQDVNIVSILNSLLISHPNFPLNEFGRIAPVPFYFVLLPILMLSGLLVGQKKVIVNLSLIFLLFAFLAKGANEPFGQIYSWLINNFPLGIAFRDSSKFFTPLLLTASLLLSLSVESARERFKDKLVFKLTFLCIYIYLLLLISPAFMGGLSGSLNNQVDIKSYNNLYHNLNTQTGFFRTLWFSERPPLGYSSWEKPGLSANELYKERPFASLIQGNYDLFGFLHESSLDQWFNLLGIKYVFFPDNERQKVWTDKQVQDRVKFISFIAQVPNFRAVSFGTNFPTYEIDGALPQVFAQKKALIVLGGEKIYQQLFKNKNFKLQNQGIIFLEQGIFDPREMFKLSTESAQLVLENKNRTDLIFSFLKNKIISTFDANLNQWAKKSSFEYLDWKSDLSSRGIDSLDFDYGKGISYSTMRGEKIRYYLSVPKRSKYILAFRYTNASESAGIEITSSAFSTNFLSSDSNRFHWLYFETPELDQGKFLVEITNLGGTVALNGLILVDKEDFNQAATIAESLIKKYHGEDKNIDIGKNYFPVWYKQINPTKYLINIPKEANWLVFTDHFNADWSIGDIGSLPFYGMVNGFYLSSGVLENSQQATLFFKPQRLIPISLLLSIGSFGLIVLGLIIFKHYRRDIK